MQWWCCKSVHTPTSLVLPGQLQAEGKHHASVAQLSQATQEHEATLASLTGNLGNLRTQLEAANNHKEELERTCLQLTEHVEGLCACAGVKGTSGCNEFSMAETSPLQWPICTVYDSMCCIILYWAGYFRGLLDAGSGRNSAAKGSATWSHLEVV